MANVQEKVVPRKRQPRKKQQFRPKNQQQPAEKGKGKVRYGNFNPNSPKTNITTTPTLSANVTSNINMVCTIDNAAVVSTMLPIATWLLNRGFIGNWAIDNEGTTPDYGMGQALQYVLSAMQDYASGGTPMISKMPKFLNVLFQALKPKTQAFKGGIVNYSWNSTLLFSLASTFSNGTGTWVFGDPTDTDVYNDLIIVAGAFIGNAVSYGAILKYFENAETLTEMCGLDTKEVTSRDTAAFARQFAYNGTGSTSTGGWYTDCELEVAFRCNLFAKFVPYGVTNTRVGRFLVPNSGDACGTTGIPLQTEFKYNQYRNKYTDIYKCIDLYEIVSWLAAWAVAIKNKYLTTNFGTEVSAELALPFSFSLQDFTIVVRQTLMAMYGSQIICQFLQPISTVGGNYFVPLIGHFGTYGNTNFLTMQMPQLFAENLASLKFHEFQPPVAFKAVRNVYRFIPVLGYFKTDTLPSFTFGEVPIQLFNTGLGQSPINMNDGQIGPNFVNMNGMYYRGVLEEWNHFVSVAQQFSTPVVAVGSDKGAKGLHLITFTRYESLIEEGLQVRSNRPWVGKLVSNLPTKKEKRVSVKGVKLEGVKDLPSASLGTLAVTQMTSVGPVTEELLSMLDYLVLPINRVDPNGSVPSTVQLFQIESAESFTRSYSAVNDVGSTIGTSVLSRILTQAALCAPGQAASTTPMYAKIMESLAMQGQAGGLIGDLAGGLLSSLGLGALAPLANMIPM